MKTKICFEACLRKFHRGALAAALLGLVCLAGVNARAASLSPVGAWDCKITGANQGVAALYFFEDGTLIGYATEIATTPQSALTDRGATDEGRSNTNGKTGCKTRVAFSARSSPKCLIFLVGVQGFEPWTR